MNLKKLVCLSLISLAIGGCRSKQSVVDEVNELTERCWEFVDTGDFPGRGLFWVRDTAPIRTYDDRGAGLRVEYAGLDLNDLFCAVSNHEGAWNETDRDAVFEAISLAAPEWIATRNNIRIDEVITTTMSDEVYERYLLFRSSIAGKAFATIYEDKKTGFVTVLTGRGTVLE